MKRIQLLNEYDIILSETILMHDVLALEHINHNTDPTTNPVIECRCRRLCGRKTCERVTQINCNDGETNNLP